MKIECTTTFLDGRDRFEKGDIRTVPDANGYRFIAFGWATQVNQPAAAADCDVSLDIHHSAIGLGDSNG